MFSINLDGELPEAVPCSTQGEAALTLRECLKFTASFLDKDGPFSLSTLCFLHNGIMGSWLQFSWLTAPEAVVLGTVEEVKRCCEILEFRIGHLSTKRRTISLLDSSDAVTGKYKALQALEDISTRTFCSSRDSGLRLRSLVRLRRVRDQQANLYGFSSYMALREQRDMRCGSESAYMFLQALDQRFARDVSVSDRRIIFRAPDDVCQSVPLLPVSRVFASLEHIVRARLGLSLSWPKTLDQSSVDLAIVKVFCGSNLIGVIQIDVRPHSSLRRNQTIPIARRVTVGDQFQTPIALVSFRFKLGADLISLQDTVSFFHEMGHAIDHILEKSPDPTKGGLTSRPIDELEVCARWIEAFALLPEFLQCASEGMSTSNKRILASAVSSLTRERYLAYLPFQVATAAFDILLYSIPIDRSRSERLAEIAYQSVARDFELLSGISLADISLQMDVSHIDRYQCANHCYLWSHSLSCGTDVTSTSAIPAAGGLYEELTKACIREPLPRAERLVATLTSK